MISDYSLRQFRLFMIRLDCALDVYKRFDKIIEAICKVQRNLKAEPYHIVLVERYASQQPSIMAWDKNWKEIPELMVNQPQQ